jgi:hypothetical protein
MKFSGKDHGRARQRKVERFQALPPGFATMILSPRAGGVGVTLTAANHVIHLSRWWNPAVEDQSTDRVFRIGQTKPVQVYFPMAIHPEFGDHSFDAVLHRLLERKRAVSRELLFVPSEVPHDLNDLYDSVIGPIDTEGTHLGDIDLFSPHQFETWALDRLKAHGWRVNRTVASGDGGADGLASHPDSELRLILQCKHTAVGHPCDDEAVDDLLRARQRFDMPDARLVAITNAPRFTSRAVARASDHGIVLVARVQLSAWPLGSI